MTKEDFEKTLRGYQASCDNKDNNVDSRFMDNSSGFITVLLASQLFYLNETVSPTRSL